MLRLFAKVFSLLSLFFFIYIKCACNFSLQCFSIMPAVFWSAHSVFVITLWESIIFLFFIHFEIFLVFGITSDTQLKLDVLIL